jgi:hypothetical protein
MFAPDELIAALSDGGVDYVLIGGLADGNLDRLANVLRVIEAHTSARATSRPGEFPFDPLKPDDLREGGNFVLATRLGRLDIMQWVPGIPGDLAFEHLSRGAITTSLGGGPVRVCSRDDLIAMKRAAGRSQDLLDLEELGES